RETRTKPHRDEKILVSWNALLIKALLKAGYYCNQPQFTQAGLQALHFIKDTLWQKDHLFASFSQGKANLNAYLDDYAFLLDAILTCLQ
ncbi:hypothetical protein ACS26N_27250, partial [Bacillus cereus group sp. BC232]